MADALELGKDLKNLYPLPPSAFEGYLQRVTPQLDPARLQFELLQGAERQALDMPTAGDLTLALKYKNRLGAAVSLALSELGDIELHQFQGCTGKIGYRVTTGLKLPHLFADQLLIITDQLRGPFRRLVMPYPEFMTGMGIAKSDRATERYNQLRKRLGLRDDSSKRLFVKELVANF